MVDKIRVMEKFLTFWLPQKVKIGDSMHDGEE